MFSQESVCPQRGGYLWSYVLSEGSVGISGTRSIWGVQKGGYVWVEWVCPGGLGLSREMGNHTHPNMGYQGIWLESEYASYWNAFLLPSFFLP